MLKLALFPLHTVLFPGMSLPLHIFEPRYRRLVDQCIETDSPFGVVLIQSGHEVGGPAVPHTVGTAARIAAVERLPAGRLNIEAVGQHRFQIADLFDDEALLTATVADFPLARAGGRRARTLAQVLLPWLRRYLNLLGEAAETRLEHEALPRDPASIGYLAAIVAQIPVAEKQGLLATRAASDLLQLERAIFRREISLLRAMRRRERSHDSAGFSPN